MATINEPEGTENLPTDLTINPQASPGDIVLPQDNAHEPTTNDFQLVNLLYVNYFPQVPDSERETLALLSKALRSWQAWESAECERQAVEKVGKGHLPADHSFASIMKRMTYRAKVTDWLRGSTATWLTKVGTNLAQPLSETVKNIEAPLAILNRLSDRYIQSGIVPEQFRVVLKPISRVIALGEKGIRQKYFITHTRYEYDSKKKAFVAGIEVNYFDVELSPAKEKAAGSVTIKYEFADYTLKFDPETWNKVQPGIDDGFLEKGHRVLSERTLDLTAGGIN